MHLHIHQLNSHIGDLKQNASAIIERANAGSSKSIAVFPELMLCGYPPQDLAGIDWFLGHAHDALEHLRCNLRPDVLCLFGTVVRSSYQNGKRAQNVCIGITNNSIVHQQAKFLLPTYDIFDEARNFEPGRSVSLLRWENMTIATAICEDIWGEVRGLYRSSPIPQILAQKPDLFIVLCASPYTKQKHAERIAILSHIARTYDVVICYCNAVGATDGIVFDGRSMVINPKGSVILQAPIGIETGIDFACPPARVKHAQKTTKGISTHPPEQFVGNTESYITNFYTEKENHHETSTSTTNHEVDRQISLPKPNFQFLQESLGQEIIEVISLGIRDFFKKNGFSRVHLGLSGGIDSALVAALACIALGSDVVHGILMPSPFSSDASITDAQKVASALNMQTSVVPIEQPYQLLSDTVTKAFLKKDVFSITHENLQARIRGTILMAYANEYRSLLLSTGNKSELSVGYCTLYGDMCGGLAVIADLYKTEVYTLYRYIQKNIAPLPEQIRTKPPSAELRPNQTDQDSLPPYDQLDVLLYAFIEEHCSETELIKAGHDKAVVEHVFSLLARAEFKRYQAPPIIKISPLSFGDGRRISISTRLHFFAN